jgi:hypothetical protein
VQCGLDYIIMNEAMYCEVRESVYWNKSIARVASTSSKTERIDFCEDPDGRFSDDHVWQGRLGSSTIEVMRS